MVLGLGSDSHRTQLRTFPRHISAITYMYMHTTILYRIVGTFWGVKFSCFLWLSGKPRNFYPRNSTA